MLVYSGIVAQFLFIIYLIVKFVKQQCFMLYMGQFVQKRCLFLVSLSIRIKQFSDILNNSYMSNINLTELVYTVTCKIGATLKFVRRIILHNKYGLEFISEYLLNEHVDAKIRIDI